MLSNFYQIVQNWGFNIALNHSLFNAVPQKKNDKILKKL